MFSFLLFSLPVGMKNMNILVLVWGLTYLIGQKGHEHMNHEQVVRDQFYYDSDCDGLGFISVIGKGYSMTTRD